jgi:hypothetical protein
MLVWEQRAEYAQTGAHRVKHEIASGIIERLKSRGARFLQRVEPPEGPDTQQATEDVMAPCESLTDRFRIIKIQSKSSTR